MVVSVDWYTVAYQRGSSAGVIFTDGNTNNNEQYIRNISVKSITTYFFVGTSEFNPVIDDDGAVSTLMRSLICPGSSQMAVRADHQSEAFQWDALFRMERHPGDDAHLWRLGLFRRT